MKRFATILIAVVFASALTMLIAADSPKASIGSTAPDFSLQNQSGKVVNLADFKGKVVVLEWTNPDCPFVQRHYKEKTMATLADKYSTQGVQWLAINSTSSADNSANAAWISENHLNYPILNDSTGQTGQAYGAKTTPHMFVIDKTGTLVYKGAIDDDPRGNKSDRVNYVDKALGEVLAGHTVSTPETKSYGCSVKY